MAFGRRKVQSAVGTATTSDVLSGFTFSSAVAGINAKGLMPNQGQPILQPGQSLAAGYYSGGQAAAPGSGSVSFTTPGTYSWTVSSGVTRIRIVVGGAGGGGQGGTSTTGGTSGCPGGWVLQDVIVNPFEVITITIGAGGAGGTAGGGTGSAGGTTTVTNGSWTIQCTGGSGGGVSGQVNGTASSNAPYSGILYPPIVYPTSSPPNYSNAGTSTAGGDGMSYDFNLGPPTGSNWAFEWYGSIFSINAVSPGNTAPPVAGGPGGNPSAAGGNGGNGIVSIGW